MSVQLLLEPEDRGDSPNQQMIEDELSNQNNEFMAVSTINGGLRREPSVRVDANRQQVRFFGKLS